MLDPPTKVQYVGRGMIWILTGTIPGLLFALVATVLQRSYDFLSFLVVVGVGALLSGGTWAALLSQEIRRSRRRMGDPMYRAKLVDFGTRASRQAPSSQG